MMWSIHSLILLAASLVLVTPALALEIAFGGALGNITASQMLAVPPGPYLDACTSQCAAVNTTIYGCSDTNDPCLCTNDVATRLVQCEQCMLDNLVQLNIPQPDSRVGTNTGLQAFATACAASTNITFNPKPALVISPHWTGSADIILNTGTTVAVVGFGAILGGSALLMLSNI